ncbi:MAG TPA: acyl-CoA dehydrogenase family protein [Conexibacter sp.]|jgi:alkylation response protein AidB-like acyl-CoA dehydrogenase
MATTARRLASINGAKTAPALGELILSAATAAQPLIRSEAAASEELRTLTPTVVNALREAGVFRMTMPRSLGGPELTPSEQFEVLEAISIADGSAGWCAYINSTAGFFAAFLDDRVARSMFPSLDLPIAGMPIPVGRAVEVDGGFRINGRWSFASGILHAGWVLCGCRIHDDAGQPVSLADGSPANVVGLLPSEQVEVIDNWDSLGMRGSGSHDFIVNDVFVPRERTLNAYTSVIRVPRPLYRWRTMFLFNQAAVVLGIARAALDAFIELAHARRTPTGPLHEQEHARVALAKAHATLASSRGYCLATLDGIYATLERGKPLTLEQRADFRLALTHSMRAAADAVDEVFRAAGATAAIRTGSVLERCFRDVHTAGQHAAVGPDTYEVTGTMLLGSDPGDPRY